MRPLATDRHAQPRHAVVLGASMGGLLAARVLADHVERVTILERDAIDAAPAHRKGVPQGRHAHGLLAAGALALERLFPRLRVELLAAGAMPNDPGVDMRWHMFGGYKTRGEIGNDSLMVSRPLLEAAVRRRVRALPNVTLVDRADVHGLLAREDGAGAIVRGVRVDDGGGARELVADLVVDAGGRGSRTPAWLRALGYEPPPEERVPVDVTYTTRVLARDPSHIDGLLGVLVAPDAPRGRRGAALLAIEDGRWILTMIGVLGERAPTDDAGFLAFARSLPAPEVAAVVERARPIGDFVTYRFAASVRRRYERLARFPRGLVVFGDALASFNPIYGQGMTVATQEALALSTALGEGTLETVAARFFPRATRAVDNPWTIAVGEDLRYPEVPGPRPLPVRVLHRYLAAVHRATMTDAVVCRAFHRVSNMLAAPPSLMRPEILARVAVAALGRRAATAERASVPATAPAPARGTW
jgi:2-polyprenyl-6-methoxyphenol hydroxylase-like FAD-dependent oxidoreductase